MAYTVILVDDEDDVRGRIATKIEGQDDFKVIRSASNGYDALDLLEEIVPDVVITDIKMPFVDGIELTRIIREQYPTVKVAIISGYDDYSYLKEAINLDVVAYLSKPISNENINEFLEKIKLSIDEEKEHIRLKEDMLLTQIRNRIIKVYLNNTQIIGNEEDMLDKLGISINNKHIIVSTELMNYSGSIIEKERQKNQCFLIAEEIINEKFNAYHIVEGKYIVSIIEVSGDGFKKELDLILYKVINYLIKFLSVDIVMGVSSIGEFENLSNLYRQSQLVLEVNEITSQSVINYYEDLNLDTHVKYLETEEINEFKNNIRYMTDTDFSLYAREFAEKIKEIKSYDYFNLMITLSGLLIEYANSIESNMNLNFDLNIIKNYVETKNIEGFITLVIQLIKQLKTEVVSRKTKKSVQLMSDIMSYIESNYHNAEISMDMVCEEFHISISYISALFKKETETTFNKYLVAKRINHAKMLLNTTGDKMVTIAEKCGYKDVYYFSHSFKKVVGQSPKRYRNDEDN